MSEMNFLRYRLEVVRLMPEGAYKSALLISIRTSLKALSVGHISEPLTAAADYS